MRDIDEADVPSIPDTKGEREGLQKLEYTIELITPMFGGGHEAGEIETDPEMVIRGSSIRGHLRFWWRATRGTNCENWEELLQKENEIWGSTSHPSKIQIEVIVSTEKIQRDNILLDQNNSYVLFPYRQNAVNRRVKSLKQLSFILKITCPDGFVKDVEAAVWAWTNFGGIGARTRRGCGSLYCENFAPINVEEIQGWFEKFAANLSKPCSWPVISHSSLYYQTSYDNNPIQCWKKVIDVYKMFRQGIGIGRNGKYNKGKKCDDPERSFWPEPESIRNLIIEQRKLGTRPNFWHIKDSDISIRSFPRVEFGMPITFKIGEEDIEPTIKPSKDGQRMASPIIIKPLKVVQGSNNGASFIPIIFILSVPPVDKAYIEPGIVYDTKKYPNLNDRTDLLKPYYVKSEEIRVPKIPDTYQKHPIYNRSKNNSAIEAFIHYIVNNENFVHWTSKNNCNNKEVHP